jgi:hypothetical protein
MAQATPIWLGRDTRPLLGFLHVPQERSARGGVVVCPPFDRDYLHAHYALRMLAEEVCSRGLCVLRFDYDGTGDSAGRPGDPDRVESWLGSVAAALGLVRSTGVSNVSMVGMRIGATLAGVAAVRDGAVDNLVLWDPVASGRTYLAEQRALSALALGRREATSKTVGDDGAVETPGMRFDGATARDLAALDLVTAAGPLARRVLVLTRSGAPEGRLGERLDLPHVEWGEATGQAQLMDIGSPNQVLPAATIERTARWIGAAAPGPAVPLRLPAPAGPAVVDHAPDGAPVVEVPAALGPAGLFGVVTEVPGRAGGPTVLFLNVANEHRLGPARLWVDLARLWAPLGVRSCRVDLSGLGDSPTRHPGQPRFVTRAPEAFDDVQDACRALSPDDPSNVVLVGLCASAYQALDSAFDVLPRGVVSINPVLSFRPPEVAAGGAVDPRRHAAIPRRPATEVLHGNGPIVGLRHRVPRLASQIRDLVEGLEGLLAPREQRPLVWLGDLVARDVDVFVVCGEREARPIRLSGSARALRRLERSGRFHLTLLPGLEHGLLRTDQRLEVVDLVSQHVLSLSAHWAPRPAGSNPAPLAAPSRP